ncbi:MAG: hypothetical protein AVDCRST_MAG19-4681, partial [uncultured Thermomicrobiales bacterium]
GRRDRDSETGAAGRRSGRTRSPRRGCVPSPDRRGVETGGWRGRETDRGRHHAGPAPRRV